MKKKSIQQIFISFLKGEGVFDAYVKNFGENTTIKLRGDYFNSAFPWVFSDQGEVFWRDLDGEWQNHMKNFKETNPAYYHTRCNDCGQFIKRDLWVKKDSSDKFHAHCSECLSYYD